jgi:hypothetical protein
MHTANSIKAMGSEAVQKIAQRMAIELMGGGRFKTLLAEHLGFERMTIHNWFCEGGRPPVLAVLYMQAEIERIAARNVLDLLASSLERVRNFP